MKTTLTAYRRLWPNLEIRILLWLLCVPVFSLCYAWKCAFKEFPVNVEKIKGSWWVYGTNPQATNRCYFEELDLYWARITQTDYVSYAVELQCSLPWFRHRYAIYTRERDPSPTVVNQVEEYLKSVHLFLTDFRLVDKATCFNQTDEPMQRWHLSKYQHLDYHPQYVKPLAIDVNI